MVRVACLMMQRDEEDLLEPWLAYHGHLFGFENLFVVDNGSESSVVRDVISTYRRAGVNFDFAFQGSEWYEKKGDIMKERINSLQKCGNYDIFIPMDCDEFLVQISDTGLSCSRNGILELLSEQKHEKSILRSPVLLYNTPGAKNYYYMMNQLKVFFASTKVYILEHGNHGASLGWDAPVKDLSLTYLHFHNRQFRSIVKHALQKLSCRVNVNDLDAVASYTGHGDHLVKYFSMSEADYVHSFASRNLVEFKEFGDLLDTLKVGAGINRLCSTEVADFTRSGAVIPATFDAKTYLSLNPDVANSGMPPLVHYYKFGRRESRRISHETQPTSAQLDAAFAALPVRQIRTAS